MLTFPARLHDVFSHQLQPSANAKRLVFTNNKLNVIDGPFSESKEMIGGFVVLDLESMDEAIELSRTLAAMAPSSGSTSEMYRWF